MRVAELERQVAKLLARAEQSEEADRELAELTIDLARDDALPTRVR